MKVLGVFALISLQLWTATVTAKPAARGSRKIQSSVQSSSVASVAKKRNEVPTGAVPAAAKALPYSSAGIAAYTPAGSVAVAAGSTGAAQASNFDPSILAGILGALGGGGGGGNKSNSANSAPAPEAPTQQASSVDNTAPNSSSQLASLQDSRNSSEKSLNSTQDLSGFSGGGFGEALCGPKTRTLVTHYGSDSSQYASLQESRMEGGEKDRYGKKLNSIEDAIRNGRPVTLAGDIYGEFGRRCNKSPSQSCLMLVCYKNLDSTFPAYREKYPGVQKNCLVGVVVDTGGAFFNKGDAKIDVATSNIGVARTLSDHGASFYELNTVGCHRGEGDMRACQIGGIKANCEGSQGVSAGAQRQIAGSRQ